MAAVISHPPLSRLSQSRVGSTVPVQAETVLSDRCWHYRLVPDFHSSTNPTARHKTCSFPHIPVNTSGFSLKKKKNLKTGSYCVAQPSLKLTEDPLATTSGVTPLLRQLQCSQTWGEELWVPKPEHSTPDQKLSKRK